MTELTIDGDEGNSSELQVERQEHFRQIAKSLIESRTQALALYKDVMSYQPFDDSATFREILEDLCEMLVDYTGKVHFNLLNNIQDEFELDDNVIAMCSDISHQLVDNTQQILDFHDLYNSDVKETQMEKLNQSLNELGEIIADRITLEDKVISIVLK